MANTPILALTATANHETQAIYIVSILIHIKIVPYFQHAWNEMPVDNSWTA